MPPLVEQNFEQEMAGLPGCYASPNGAILIASVLTDSGTQDAGAVAVRPLLQKGKPPPQLHNADATAAEHSGAAVHSKYHAVHTPSRAQAWTLQSNIFH